MAERSIWCERTAGHGSGLRPSAGLDEDGLRTSTADEHGPRKQGREIEFSCLALPKRLVAKGVKIAIGLVLHVCFSNIQPKRLDA
ncbi:hypothetical protein DY000_02008722 [Brassica cretica]|uniref:Uncharacterized protein n=1 Tax=Brassica cretica TaxID=69181 RepID=A0ABQ7CIG3_BRACR|nr:hypothetical protein DY000_02008722 [Brassica cretica]